MDERYRLNLDRVVRDKVWSEPASPAATGAGSLTGAGTATYLAKWTGGTMLGDSMIIDSIAGDVATLDATLTAGRTYTLSDVAGTFALGAGTLTAATGSDVTIAAHLHPITNTADGATNHSTILSSSAAGALTLDDYFTIDGGTVGISGNELLTFNAAGTITVTGADFDLDGRKLILDPDGDTYLYASGDDIVDLVLNGLSGTFAIRINGVLDFSFTEDSFNILSGSYITMADDTWIGLGAAAGRFVFDSTPSPDQIDITSADLNFATASHGIIHTDGVTAGELLRADGTRYVPTGWYLMGTAAQTYTLGTSGGTVSTSPGTLSASTVNSTTGAGVHTHAITSSDDGAANHNTLLESDGSGRITMDDYFTIDGGSFGVSGNELL
ncbi:MAG: hypothetical protein GY841_10445, partial [FCB group bacterium]|nr:hypothetical protein [FCB group bacterium]